MRLVADIGGSNARFALSRAPGELEQIKTLPGAEFPSLAAAAQARRRHPENLQILHGAPHMSFKFPLATSSWDQDEQDAIQRVIASDMYSMGPEVAKF